MVKKRRRASRLLTLFAVFLFPLPAFARGDGILHLYAYHLKETSVVHYRDGEKILPEGVTQIQKIFRSRDSDREIALSPKLLEVLDHIEDHFGVRQVEIISGYRSREFNQGLKESGRKVAKESLHIQGMAADVHLDEVTEEALRDYAQSLNLGGVGYYPSLHFVHVDVGPVRHWAEDAPRKVWVGESNPDVPVKITVTPARSVKEKSLGEIFVEGGRIEPDLEIEFFDRGRWTAVGLLKNVATAQNAKTSLQNYRDVFEKLPFGKFRLKAKIADKAQAFQYSNEFYFKKI